MSREREHQVKIRGYRWSPQELGRELARLRYDALLAVLYGMSIEIYRQMQEDSGRERKQLAKRLADLYSALALARQKAQITWSLCRPHAKAELEKKPEIKTGQIAGY